MDVYFFLWILKGVVKWCLIFKERMGRWEEGRERKENKKEGEGRVEEGRVFCLVGGGVGES